MISAYKTVSLGEIVCDAPVERAADNLLPVLSMTRASGLVPQTQVFNKVVASRDLSKYKVVRPNQLVVGIHIDEGAIGFSGPTQTGLVSPAYKLWNLTKPRSVDTRYLDAYIRSPTAVEYFIANYRQTAERRGKITKDRFLALQIPLPPLAEQKRIADILDKADAIRRKRQQAIEQLDTLVQSTFLDMFGDPSKATKFLPLGQCVTMQSGGTPSKANAGYWNGNFPWVSPKDMKVDVIADAADHVTDAAFSETNLKRIPAAAVLIVVRGMILAHTVPIAVTDTAVAINQDMKALIANVGFEPEFICGAMRVSENLLLSRVATAAHGTKRLEVESITALKIPEVALERQREFTNVVRRIRKLQTQFDIAETTPLFASLQHRAFAGEL